MFTGIIEESGTINRVQRKGEGSDFSVSCPVSFMKGVKLGDSIAINGACQTVTEMSETGFVFFSSLQTLEITNLGQLKTGSVVNMEKALQLGQRLDGHLVSGHVDGLGQVSGIVKQQEGYLFSFSVSENVLDSLVLKGSITVDGISLTIYDLQENIVTVSVIPFTFEHTTLKNRKPGDKVNIESDILGKYVVQFLKRRFDKNESPKSDKISLDFLAQNGFL